MALVVIYFFYGLAFFALGQSSLIESRRGSDLYLGRQLPWLAAYALVHSIVVWTEMFAVIYPEGAVHGAFDIAHMFLLPISALLLIRFGVGLIGEGSPLPAWLAFAPVAILVPLALLAAYAIIVISTQHPVETAVEVWARYLFYLPGCVLAAIGFFRERSGLPRLGLDEAHRLMFGAGAAFAFNAIVAGLIVPPAAYGLAPWLNSDLVMLWTGLPIQLLRAVSAFAVMFLVIYSYGIFEAEQEQRLGKLRKEREAEQESARAGAEAWTNGLVGLSRHIANWENIDSTLVGIVELARKLLNADTASLGLLNSSGNQILLKCFASANESKILDGLRVQHPLIRQVADTSCAVLYPGDLVRPVTPWICPVLHNEIRTGAIVPLKLDNRSVGAIWVARFTSAPFTLTDAIGLERLADDAVIAIEHAEMGARLQSFAVTEERGRIAREMHDGLAQILGYLSLQMQTLESLTKQGKTDAMLRELRQARDRISQAQSDVRENILSLRTTLGGQAPLIPSLREYVEEFGIQTGIRAVLHSKVEDAPPLSPLAEAQLARIVQEALTNTRKHSGAESVDVSLARVDDELQVLIQDDGIGMTIEPSKYHFGLQTMRERAESVDGRMVVDSTLGQGTQVEVWLPLLSR